jgi:hypothetical protein
MPAYPGAQAIEFKWAILGEPPIFSGFHGIISTRFAAL